MEIDHMMFMFPSFAATGGTPSSPPSPASGLRAPVRDVHDVNLVRHVGRRLPAQALVRRLKAELAQGEPTSHYQVHADVNIFLFLEKQFKYLFEDVYRVSDSTIALPYQPSNA